LQGIYLDMKNKRKCWITEQFFLSYFHFLTLLMIS
jgi:hypothetical protein